MRLITNIMVNFVKKYLPSPFVLAIILTIFVFLMGVIFNHSTPVQMTVYWGDGVFELLTFTMQMILLMITGYALATSKPFVKLLKKMCSIPNNPIQAIFFASMITMILTYFNWGLGLICAGLIARELSIQLNGKGLHFPLLVASTYSSAMIIGIGSAATLIVATKGHFLEEIIGVVPLTDTVFRPWSVTVTLVLFFVIPLVYVFMRPPKGQAFEPDPSVLDIEDEVATVSEAQKPVLSEKMEHSQIFTIVVALLGGGYMIHYFITEGVNMSLNALIMLFITLGMIAHRTPAQYMSAIQKAVTTTAGIALLFPFYSGIMGMLTKSGMTEAITNFWLSHATAETLPLISFLSAGLVNIFIPSGGGQWIVQGPLMVPAALELGVEPAKVVLAVAWGDLWTNNIQPFWILPILAIARLGIRDVMGYCVVISLVMGALLSVFFLFI
ncbi:short-chain fatty acid transporter [Lentibacillus daqui]|uniref:short-chain fatty acid transporter n=1 Tax=Lentibacillus daqui TaxID=2911514 RepID=UPI0022B0CA78|nr:TIGR00366 family protein [Lentibacillus daqui]